MPLLRYKYEPGKKVVYTVRTTSKRDIAKGGELLERQEQSVTTEVRAIPIAVDEEGIHLKLITKVKDYSTTVRSSKGEESSYHASEEELLSQEPYKIYLLIDDKGRIKEIIGGNEVPALILPEEEVEVGSSWMEENLFSLPMLENPIKLKLKYTLRGIEDGLALISLESLESNFSLPIKVKLEDKEQTYTADYLLEVSGKFFFSIEDGLINNHSLRITVRAKMDVYMIDYESVSEMTLKGIEE